MRFIVKLLILMSFLVVYSPTYANDFASLNGFQQNEAYAGAYLSFKFGAGSKRIKKNRIKYGIAAGLRRQSFSFSGISSFNNHLDIYNYHDNSLFEQSKLREVRVFDTAFDREGFKSVNFANIPVYKRNQYGELEFVKLGLDDTDTNGSSPWKTAFKWGAIVMGGILLGIITLAIIIDDEDFG